MKSSLFKNAFVISMLCYVLVYFFLWKHAGGEVTAYAIITVNLIYIFIIKLYLTYKRANTLFYGVDENEKWFVFYLSLLTCSFSIAGWILYELEISEQS